jgi:hypothetical protein
VVDHLSDVGDTCATTSFIDAKLPEKTKWRRPPLRREGRSDRVRCGRIRLIDWPVVSNWLDERLLEIGYCLAAFDWAPPPSGPGRRPSRTDSPVRAGAPSTLARSPKISIL